ncbi:MAG: hypothetical protein EPO24_07710 [Bacteroidetes bacterium]|nr:MAG: hypothetical protein EPO24_07710 [Bacteroidota bacterium]
MSRPKINTIRERVAVDLAENAMQYKRALLREIDALWRASGGTSTSLSVTEREERLEVLIKKVSAQFKIKPAAQKLLTDEVKQAQAEIKEVWADYFRDRAVSPASGINSEHGAGVIKLKPGEYEKLRSLYKVDFKGLQDEQREIIMEEVRKAVGAGKGFTDLRDALGKRGMGAAHAETLANTSLAAFDNAIHVEFATQSGITKFKYDGPVNATTRPFCREHAGKIYTIAELDAMDNGQGLKPTSVYLGGYRCQHYLTAQVDGLSD